MGYLTNSGSGFMKDAVTTVSNVKSYLINKTGYLVDAIRIGIGDFGQRVLDDSGTVEASAEAAASYREITKDIYDQASLVLFPSGYKESKVYSHKPVDGSGDFTYTRGTDTATRVGADGYIKKERANFLEQSNQFDTDWNLSGGSTLNQNAVGINNIPNTAWTFTKDSTFDGIKQNISLSGINTFSVYAKKIDSSVNELVLRINVAGGNRVAIFDLSNGNKVSMTSHSSAVHYDIQKVGNGWYRCSFVVAGTIANVDIRMDYNQTGTGSMLVQNAQLEQGLVATPYIETTTAPVYEGLTDSMPRIDYTGGTPSILLEPSRVNKITQSEYLGAWSESDVSIDFGYLSPDGSNNAYKITANGSQPYIVASAVNILPNDTRSIWAKTTSGTGTAHLLTHNSNTNNLFTITNEWQRFDISSVTTTTGENNFYGVDLRGSSSLTEILIWGAQSEEGSYPTSYIPTYNSSATRAADVFNDLTYSDGFNDITVFLNISNKSIIRDSSNSTILIGNDGNEGGAVFLRRTSQSNPKRLTLFFKYDDNSDVFSSYQLPEGDVKLAFKYNDTLNYCKLFVDGDEVRSETDMTDIIEFDTFKIGGLGGEGNLKSLLVFNTELTDNQCEALTTP